MPSVLARKNVRLLLFASSAVLLLMQLPAYFAQNKNRDWQSGFTVLQSELTLLSASMLLEQHRLQEAFWRHASAREGKTRVNLLRQLHAYASRFGALDDRIGGRLRQLKEQDGLREQLDIESSEFELSVKSLQASGPSTLKLIEEKVSGPRPSGHAELLSAYEELADLNGEVTRFLLDGFEFSRQLNREQVELAERLNRRLQFSQFSIIYGMLMFGVALIVYLQETRRLTRTLERTNSRLESEIDESQRLAQELEQRANHDGLSGLLNRRGFVRQLECVLSTEEGFHGLCFLDMDRFKIVNDTSGHSAGDRLIRMVADRLRARVGESGVVARFGGDEFLVLMPGCDRSRFECTITGLCRELRDFVFDHCGERFDISGSFGAVHFDASEQSVQSLMAIVDAECHEAKRAGGARVHFHGKDDSVVQARKADVRLVSDIHRALSEDGFRLFRQPIHSLHPDGGSSLHGWEILLRMIGEDGESVPPQRILNVAERFSLASKIDRWVVGHAFEWLNRQAANLAPVDRLNINLSGRSVGDSEFLSFLEARTLELAVDTGRVCFEITETAAAGAGAREFIQRLKRLGYRLALDDFGAGFSSFGYLESLPVDYIKIDGLFVRDIDTNETHSEFVKAIGVVGKAMGKLVVAEFVSNEKSVRILERLGIDYVQGYHFGRPTALPATPVPALPPKLEVTVPADERRRPDVRVA